MVDKKYNAPYYLKNLIVHKKPQIILISTLSRYAFNKTIVIKVN